MERPKLSNRGIMNWKPIFLLVFTISSLTIFAQDTLKDDHPESSKQLLFFSNDGCGKCSIAQNYFDNHEMPYTKYAVRESRPLMYEYIHKKTGGKNVGVGYPVIVYGDSVYFSIKNIDSVLSEVEEMMIQDVMMNKETSKSHKEE